MIKRWMLYLLSKLNNIFTKNNCNRNLAYFVFVFSFIIYALTASRTVNFWDCGEIILSAYNLEVGHPPGAPTYMLLANIFSSLAFSPQNVAFLINLLSALFASLAVLLTYLTAQYLSIKLLNQETLAQKYKLDKDLKLQLSYISALIASLTLAFSHSFWASAIEAEVYAASLFFTALNVWIAIKSTQTQDKNKWFLLNSLLLGLAIGVHQLNILVIPAIIFIYFFDNYKFSIKSFSLCIVASALLTLIAQFSLESLAYLASKIELLCVNILNWNYNTGLYCFVVLIIICIITGIYITGKKGLRKANLIITCISVFILGLSTYSIILIRSSANPPIDQNNPETIFNFLSYIKREQYGNYPLLYGQQYNSKQDEKTPYIKGEPVYDTVNNRYDIITYKPKINYKDSDKTLFPRLWSNLPEHVAAYKEWTGYKQDKIPSFKTNINFFLNYQFSHLYMRYFLWNFVGKQNDAQSHGGSVNGNWITGFSFLDKIRLDNPNSSISSLHNNKANTPYYILPLILGIIGIAIQLKYNKKSFFILLLIFLITSISLIFYLNQTPYQARERDYSYLASFYVFSIWIGLGSIGVFIMFNKYVKSKYLIYAILFAILLAVPIQFLIKNFKSHNIKDNDIARSMAYNTLTSCNKNAILFVSGDNETFPLWYLQEVENIRTDVSVININFLNTDWYIDQITRNNNKAHAVSLSIDKLKYRAGQRELLLVKHNPYPFIEDIYISNIKEIQANYQVIYNKFKEILLKSKFPTSRPLEFDNFINNYQYIPAHGANRDFKNMCKAIFGLEDSVQAKELNIPEEEAKNLINLLRVFLNKQTQYPISLNQALNFTFSEDSATKIKTLLYDTPIDYFPANYLFLPINTKQATESFANKISNNARIVDKMIWKLDNESLTKSDLICLEIICNNLWQRPIYFSSLLDKRALLGLEKYLFLEGLAFQLIPIETDMSENDPVNVNSQAMYDNVKQFTWGKLSDKKTSYYDEVSRIYLINLRNHFSRLARGLYFEGEIRKSEEMLDTCIRLIPNEMLAFDYYSVGIIHGYYRIGKKLKARQVAQECVDNAMNDLQFYKNFSKTDRVTIKSYQQKAMKTIEEIYIMAVKYQHREYIEEITEIYENAKKIYGP